jgi:signal transduction histidine kinase
MEVAITPCALTELVHEVCAAIQPLAESKGIRVAVPRAHELPRVSTDAHRLRQILLNLLSNAVKFTDTGEVTLRVVRVDRVAGRGGFDAEPGAGWIEIHVSDTGSGIAPENLERIFAEFEQVTGPDAHKGTGLGLPISRRLARLLGGDLSAESEIGVGSTFVLRLPGCVRSTAKPETMLAGV